MNMFIFIISDHLTLENNVTWVIRILDRWCSIRMGFSTRCMLYYTAYCRMGTNHKVIGEAFNNTVFIYST